MTRVGALIVAAGASTRLGQPKQLVTLTGEKLLERAVRVASVVCDPVVVVLGSNAELIQAGCNLAEARVVLNPNWVEGLGSSIATGIKHLPDLDGVVVLTCDMPAVTVKHLRGLMESGSLAASFYGGRCGVPAFFPACLFPRLLALRGEVGAQSLLEDASAMPLPFGEIDVDTIADLELARKTPSVARSSQNL